MRLKFGKIFVHLVLSMWCLRQHTVGCLKLQFAVVVVELSVK